MFAWIKRGRPQGKTYEYLQVVESVRTGGTVRQRVVGNLGWVDQLPKGGAMTSSVPLSASLSSLGSPCRTSIGL